MGVRRRLAAAGRAGRASPAATTSAPCSPGSSTPCGRSAPGGSSIDSLGGIFAQLDDDATIRHELFRIASSLKKMGVTAIITAERTEEYGQISRYGVEEFVSDNVIILRNALQEEVRRRTVEILKFRGTTHQKGEWPFTIVPDEGIVVIPLSALELKQKSSDARITSGNRGARRDVRRRLLPRLDHPGLGADRDGQDAAHDRVPRRRAASRASAACCSPSRRAASSSSATRPGWGIDFAQMEAGGLLARRLRLSRGRRLEDHLIRIKKEIEEFSPDRVADRQPLGARAGGRR